MLSFPNCKINIGLRVVGKRPDGFHNIETIFYPVPLRDAVEIVEENKASITFSQTGLNIPGLKNDNICIKAYQCLQKDYPQLPDIKIHLHKAIPIGAGLGGGSADASFILKLVNQKFELGLSNEQLVNYAVELGSDCPFFLINKPCYATGRGEVLEEIPMDLSSYKIVLINPGIHIDTGRAFRNININSTKDDLRELVSMPIERWQANIKNDFELAVFSTHPEIAEIKTTLISSGARFASMSGSGSTVFGIFRKGMEPAFNFPPDYFCKWV